VTRRVATLTISVGTALISIFLPFPYSVILAILATVVFFSAIGRIAAVVGGILALIITLPHLYMSEFALNRFENAFIHSNRIPGLRVAKSEMKFEGIKTMKMYGKNLKLVVDDSFSAVVLEKGLEYKTSSDVLIVSSKGSHRITSGSLREVQINGVNMEIFGRGKIETLDIDGVSNTVDLEEIGKTIIRVNGVGNRVKTILSSSVQLEVNRVGNKIQLGFQERSSGSGEVEVRGVGNEVKIYIPKGSDVHLERVEYDVLNSVDIIRR
jgi:hypothetical protein